MNNNIQCSIESSTTSMELNSAADGIYLVPELEGLAGLPEIRTTSGVNAGYDGGWTSAQNYDARLIAIRGVIADKDIAKVEATRRKLASLLGQGRKEQLTLRFTTEAGNAYTVMVRTISCEMALQRVLNKQDFLIQLRADDPLIYDDGASGGAEAILRVQQALGGFEINFGLPLAIGGSSDATAVENGAETVYPIIKLYGPLHSPTVVNMTTNQQMQIIADLGYTINWSGWTGVSGERLSIPNELDKEAPLRFWGFDGNTEQTTYTGKNLLEAKMPTTTLNGITCTNNGDGSYTLNGTATAGADFRINQSTAHGQDNLQNYDGTYTLSCNELQNDMQLIVMQNGTWSQILRMRNSNTPATGTFTKNDCFIYVYVAQGKTLNNLRIHPMLEKSATATAYEPYVGGIPAPNPQFPMPISTVTGRQTVGVVGKNFYDPNSTVFSIPANVSVEVEGNSVKVTALITTTSSNLYWRTPIPDAMLEDGKTYTISSVLGSGAYRSLRLLLRNHDGSNAGFSTGFSVTYDSRYTLFVVENPFATTSTTQVAAGTTCTISNIQVEEGSTATTYESYHWQSQEINLGKNLFDKNNANILQAGITTTKIESATANRTLWIPCEPNTTYTVQKRNDGDTNRFNVATTTVTPAIDVAITNRVEQPNAKSITYTTSATAKYLCVQYFRTAETILTEQQVIDSIQIEKGNQATDYSAYFEPIELCKIGAYQDRIYKENGKWWLEKQTGKVVLDGSESYSLLATLTTVSRYTANNVVSAKPSSQCYANNFSWFSNQATNEQFNAVDDEAIHMRGDGTGIGIKINTTTASTANALKTWLGSNNTTVYYALETPTTTEITNEEVLEGLEALGDATLYVGTNNVYTDTPSAVPTLEVDYPTDYDETHDTVVVDSQARTITLNGADIYHLKTEESEFPVLAPGENRMYLTSATTSDTGYAEVKFKQGYLSI